MSEFEIGKPKDNPDAEIIPRISAAERFERSLPDVIIERVVIEYLTRPRFCRDEQIIDGTVPGNLAKALAGEDVGTIIYG